MEYISDSIDEVISNYEGKLQKAVQHVTSEFGMIRAGRVNSALVERVNVEYFGEPTPIRNLANISCPDSRTIMISLWDTAVLRDTCKALQNANLGVNPIDDGRIIRMIFPALTMDRRKDLVKQVKKISEEGKVAMRNERRDAMDKLKKTSRAEKIGEDEVEIVEKEIQKMLDSYVASIEKILQVKEKEILEV